MRVAHRTLRSPNEGLPDVLHTILPRIHILVPDIAMVCSLIASLFFIDQEIYYLGWDRVLVSFLVRPVFVCATTLPSPRTKTEEYFWCQTHDLIFSGHTILFLAVARLFYANDYILPGLFVGFGGPLLLVAARRHYTIDILVAGSVFLATANM